MNVIVKQIPGMGHGPRCLGQWFQKLALSLQ